MFGHHGRFLFIDLTSGAVRQETFSEEFGRKFLGGNGFVAKLIHDHVPDKVDPFAPENALVFAVGPITDTPIWGTSRGHMGTISPQTGFFADSNYGGDFGLYHKRTGFDAIMVTGAASKPVYILVTEEGAEIKDASLLWGKNTEETIHALVSKEGRHSQCAAIGPAGENRVLFANVICGGRRPGAAGRGGMGAVMGAKNLKALVVRGSKETAVAQKRELKDFLKEQYKVLKENGAALRNFGTPILVNMVNKKGMLCTHNNTRETFEHAGDISGEVIREQYREKDIACYGCPMACSKLVKVPRGAFAGQSVKMPEFETLYAMGSMLDNRDIVSIFNGNNMCDLMGMDTISMGVTLSFVAECMEHGLASMNELGGRVNFGDGEAMVDLMQKTAHCSGIGAHLALGSAKLAEKFGHDAYKYLYAVKGLEIAGHSARGLRMMSLSYPTSTRGGSHHDGRPKYLLPEVDAGFDTMPDYIVRSNYFTCVGDSLVLCRFTAERGFGTMLGESLLKAVNLALGWELDLAGLERMGERIYNLERLINVKRGVNRAHDVLPYRVMNEPIPDGPSKGRYCPKETLDKMLDEYYSRRGWSSDGIPKDGKLRELGLQE